MSSDFQNFLILDLETTEQTAFPIAELPQRLEVFGWIAGYQRRSFVEEDEVSVHAAGLMGRLYDLLDASGYGGHDLGVLLVRLVFIMFADDTSVWEKTNGQSNGLGRRLAAPRSEARHRRTLPALQEGRAVRGRSLPAGEEARRLLGGAVQQGLGPLVDIVGGEAELLEQGTGRG